jgi:sugar phosphate isomerase/epimerase
VFNLATTSYIWPADILTNINHLKKYVKGIQLILFELPEETNLPNPINLRKMMQLKEEFNLEYYVHLPLNAAFFCDTKKQQAQTISELKNIMEIGEKLQVKYYVAHLNLNKDVNDFTRVKNFDKNLAKDFYQKVSQTLDLFFYNYPVKEKFLIENINYNLLYLDDFLYNYNLNFCMDIGHIFMHNESIEVIRKYADKIKLIHLHDLNEEFKDHYKLNRKNEIKQVLSMLKKYNFKGDIILEVFSRENFFDSLKFLRENDLDVFFSDLCYDNETNF